MEIKVPELKLPPEMEETFRTLTLELKQATDGLKKEEWKALLLNAAAKSALVTWDEKKIIAREWWAKIKDKFKQYGEAGFTKSLKADVDAFKETIASVPEQAKDVYKAVSELSRDEQYRAVSTLIVSTVIFGIAAKGGNNLGFLKGNTVKKFIPYTILLGLGGEFALRFIINFIAEIHGRLPKEHNKFWDSAQAIAASSDQEAVAALWAGLLVHFAKGVTPLLEMMTRYPVTINQIVAVSYAVSGFQKKII